MLCVCLVDVQGSVCSGCVLCIFGVVCSESA